MSLVVSPTLFCPWISWVNAPETSPLFCGEPWCPIGSQASLSDTLLSFTRNAPLCRSQCWSFKELCCSRMLFEKIGPLFLLVWNWLMHRDQSWGGCLCICPRQLSDLSSSFVYHQQERSFYSQGLRVKISACLKYWLWWATKQNRHGSPGRVAQLVGTSSHIPKGSGLNPQLGHIGRQPIVFSLSPPFSFLKSISINLSSVRIKNVSHMAESYFLFTPSIP